MCDAHKPRFGSSAQALRFYFRARELLDPADNLQRVEKRRESRSATMIDDFLHLRECIDGLDAFDHWLLAELYGPTCFAAGQRNLLRAYEVARQRYPALHLTPAMIRKHHHQTMDLVDRRLARRKLIGSKQ